ncbi:uncharacterized protein METZ01_LOCUS333957, partial [marine metagenome]
MSLDPKIFHEFLLGKRFFLLIGERVFPNIEVLLRLRKKPGNVEVRYTITEPMRSKNRHPLIIHIHNRGENIFVRFRPFTLPSLFFHLLAVIPGCFVSMVTVCNDRIPGSNIFLNRSNRCRIHDLPDSMDLAHLIGRHNIWLPFRSFIENRIDFLFGI